MLVAALVLIGSGLSLYKLGEKSLWLDEISTVQIASQNYKQIYKSLEREHMAPPLYYIGLHVFLNLGSDEFFVRLPSVIFFALAIIVCFLVAQILFDKTVALMASFLFALSPLSISYAQEARMYSMNQFLLLLSFYFFIKALKTKKNKLWIAYVVVTAIAAYTHYFTVFYIAVQAIFLVLITLRQWISQRKEKNTSRINLQPWFWFAVSLLCILALYLPRVSSAQARSQGMGLRRSFSEVFNMSLRYFSGIQKTTLPNLFGIIFILGLAACVLSRKKREGLLLGLWVLLPVIMTYFFLMIFQSFFAVRYVLFALPPYLIGISFGLTAIIRIPASRFKLPMWAHKIFYAGLILAVIFIHISPIQAMYSRPKQPWREIAHFFKTQVKDNEIVVIFPRWIIIGLEYYGFHSEKVISSKLETIQNVLKKRSNTWVLCFPFSEPDPDVYFQPQIKSNQCTKIIAGTYQTAGLYLYYIHLNKNKPRDMSPILKAAVHIVPKDWYIHALLADTYIKKGKIKHAISEYEKILSLRPKRLVFIRRLAQLYTQDKRLNSGIRLLKRAVKLRPNAAWNHILLADILTRTRHYDAALMEYKKAAELYPDYLQKDWYYVKLGNFYRLKNNKVPAIEAYKKALTLNSNNTKALKWMKRLASKKSP